MSAQPIHHQPEDPHDPQVILARLPERERDLFLRLYREQALAAADDPASYQYLLEFLRRWAVRAAALEQRLAENPAYYEDVAIEIEGVRNGTIPTVPIEAVLPDWAEHVAQARARRQT